MMPDVEKVIKGLEMCIADDFCNGCPYEEHCFSDGEITAIRMMRDALALLKDQEAVTPTVGGWISVDDRLPKSMANKVLVWLAHEDLVGYIGFGHYEKYQGVEMWYDLEHGEQFAKRGYAVTHWMPLPEPPKEK